MPVQFITLYVLYYFATQVRVPSQRHSLVSTVARNSGNCNLIGRLGYN